MDQIGSGRPAPTAEDASPLVSTALAVADSPIVLPAVDARGMKEAMTAYTAMCDAILVPSDYQTVTIRGEKRTFKKRAAWQKLATAFSVTTKHVDRTVHTDENGRVVRAEFVVRATAPNGRSADGYGACSTRERGFDKPDHDIPSTAETRATNRACANLFAFGELSAEEMPGDRAVGNGKGVEGPNPTTAAQPSASPAPRPLARNAVKLTRASQRARDSDGDDKVMLSSSLEESVAETPALSGMHADTETAELRLGILRGYGRLLRTMAKYSDWPADELEARTAEVTNQWCQMGYRKDLHELSLSQLREASIKLAETLRKRLGEST